MGWQNVYKYSRIQHIPKRCNEVRIVRIIPPFPGLFPFSFHLSRIFRDQLVTSGLAIYWSPEKLLALSFEPRFKSTFSVLRL